MSVQSRKKIGQKLLKLESGNDIFTQIKGHNSVVYERILPICNPKPLLPDINVHAKSEEIRSSPETKRWRTDRHSKVQSFRRV